MLSSFFARPWRLRSRKMTTPKIMSPGSGPLRPWARSALPQSPREVLQLAERVMTACCQFPGPTKPLGKPEPPCGNRRAPGQRRGTSGHPLPPAGGVLRRFSVFGAILFLLLNPVSSLYQPGSTPFASLTRSGRALFLWVQRLYVVMDNSAPAAPEQPFAS